MEALLHRFSLREFRMILIGLGVALAALLIAVAVVPKAKAFRAAAHTVELLEENSQNLGELERHLQERQAAIENLRFRLHGDMAELPIKQVEAYIIGRLQKISWRNNVEFVSVEPAMGERVQIFQESTFNVRLVGEYGDLYRWLWEAKNELGFVVIKEYGLTRQDNVDDNPRLLANLSLASYRAEE